MRVFAARGLLVVGAARAEGGLKQVEKFMSDSGALGCQCHSRTAIRKGNHVTCSIASDVEREQLISDYDKVGQNSLVGHQDAERKAEERTRAWSYARQDDEVGYKEASRHLADYLRSDIEELKKVSELLQAL